MFSRYHKRPHLPGGKCGDVIKRPKNRDFHQLFSLAIIRLFDSNKEYVIISINIFYCVSFYLLDITINTLEQNFKYVYFRQFRARVALPNGDGSDNSRISFYKTCNYSAKKRRTQQILISLDRTEIQLCSDMLQPCTFIVHENKIVFFYF